MRTFVFCIAHDEHKVCFLYPSLVIRTSSLRMAVQVFALRNKLEISDVHVAANGAARIHFLQKRWHRKKSLVYLVIVKKTVQSHKFNQETPPVYKITGLS